jgi:biopolymer transport protein ExbB/TolQ
MEPTLPDALHSSEAAAISLTELILNADIVVQGVMALLVIASVICWAIILEKALRLMGFSRQVRRLEQFAASSAEMQTPRNWFVDAMYSAGAAQYDSEPGEARSEREGRLEKAMRGRARREMLRLQRRVRFLATVGSTAPFIGLFGTVWGIMNSFTAIAAQKDTSLAVVAPGIAEALFATALGLVAAIPAVFAYNQIAGSFSRLSERINIAIAGLASEFVRFEKKNKAV